MKSAHTAKTAWLLGGLIGAALLAGCVPSLFPDRKISTNAPTIDWAGSYQLAKALFDVSFTTVIPDEQLNAIYKTDTNDVLVRSTTFPGDSSPSRYMFIKDSVARTQTVYLSGTNSETLWAFDFDLSMTNEPDFNSLVHRGFDNAALTVLDDLLPRLEIDYSTTVTGYSLGGAMAVLLAAHLQIDGYPLERVVTFGQPKITNLAGLANFQDLPLLRFMNRNDPVPHLPPSLLAGGEEFDHFGREVILYDGPSYAYLEPGDPSYKSSTTSDLFTTIAEADFSQHGTIYLDRLAAKLTEAIQIPYVGKLPKK